MGVKYVIIIPDGAADLPIPELEGRTPFEAAVKPNLDALAELGRVGCAHTTPQGFEAGSDVCSMSLLGYDPARYHTGRAPLEAAALGLTLTSKDWIFRLNFVTTSGTGEDGKMLDHSAGAITDPEARELLRDLVAHWKSVEPQLVAGIELHPGVSYRNILVDSSGRSYRGLSTTPPHAVPGEPWRQHMPRGGANDAGVLGRLMELSADFLPKHPVNIARAAAGKRIASMAWIWGQGTKPEVPSFRQRFGLKGGMITSVDLLAGIASYIGWERIPVAGLTSYHDTDYVGQGRASVDAIDDFDVLCTHIEAPDEASHQGDWKTKVASIEAIDKHIVGPIVKKLLTFGDPERDPSAKGWRVLVMPDHFTLCSTKKHDATPVPFLMAGAWVRSMVQRPFTESGAAESDLVVENGHDLMEYFLKGGRSSVRNP
jgi:2,3-bisphosphoglycerate-independent phosphoglycerate mutase